MCQKGEHSEDAAVAVAAVRDLQLAEDAAHVGLHGPFGQNQLFGDGCVGTAQAPTQLSAVPVAFAGTRRLSRNPVSTQPAGSATVTAQSNGPRACAGPNASSANSTADAPNTDGGSRTLILTREWIGGSTEAFAKDPKTTPWAYGLVNVLIYAAGLGLVTLGHRMGAGRRQKSAHTVDLES